METVAGDSVGRYRARFGHVLNADSASEFFEEYAQSPDTRATRVAAVRPAAAQIVDRAYTTLLREAVPYGRLPLVVFMSGGNGAGKSTSVNPGGPEHLVFDSTLSHFEPSVDKIERALAAGYDVDVRHLARNPVEAWHGVLHRAMHEGAGRTVSLAGHLQTHRGARETLFRLVRRFEADTRIRFLVWQNDRSGLSRRPLGWLCEQEYPSDDVLGHELVQILEQSRANGSISTAVYRGCRGNQRDD